MECVLADCCCEISVLDVLIIIYIHTYIHRRTGDMKRQATVLYAYIGGPEATVLYTYIGRQET